MISKLLAWLGGFVLGAALLAHGQTYFGMGWVLASLASCVLTYPPFVFGSEIRCERLMQCRIVMTTVFTSYVGVAVFYGLVLARARCWMDGDTTVLWVELACAAGNAFFLPVHFGVIESSTEGTCLDEKKKAKKRNGATPAATLSVDLAGGLFLAVRPGSWLDKLVKTKALRDCATAICLFYSAVGGTVVAAAVAAAAGVVAAETSLAFVSVAAAVSMAYCAPRFLYPGLNTRRSSLILYCLLLPAALAATYHAMESGGVESESLVEASKRVRTVCTFVVYWSQFILVSRRIRDA